jgi:hypothetical protein
MQAWQRIRLLRAQPPALVKGERRAVFVSALEQAEQLMQAAEEVGSAARPLPLFYALSQAGRAIGAARLRRQWRLAGHGLTMPPKDVSKALLRRVVKCETTATSENRLHAFAGVADATGSSILTGAIELGAVWAAIPDLAAPRPEPPFEDPSWRRPLRAWLPEWAGDPSPIVARRPLELLIEGLPETDSPGVLLAELAEYPTATGVQPVLLQPGGPEGAMAKHISPIGTGLPLFAWPDVSAHVVARAHRIEEIAPDYRRCGVRVLIPRLGGKDTLSPLMLWWLLLFGLSSIARYDPELWVDALDLNGSKLAVPIEAALDVAIEALPDLILEALVAPVA